MTFTHTAGAMAQMSSRTLCSMASGERARSSSLGARWCTYTDPEVAHAGVYETGAREQGRRVETITIPFRDVDRAVLDKEPEIPARATMSADGCLAARSSPRTPDR